MDGSVRPEDQKAVEVAREPAVVRNGQNGPRVGGQALLQGLGTGQVQVVGVVVQEEQVDALPGLMAGDSACAACAALLWLPVSPGPALC
ncbi:hypothetical protein GCM10009546_61080 [Actinomadura livida]|uniref:Uncharacterized protein n=1 Tax=Actinomadura livida TaxID=79909 RepID=A0ABN1FGR4_9ACTN